MGALHHRPLPPSARIGRHKSGRRDLVPFASFIVEGSAHDTAIDQKPKELTSLRNVSAKQLNHIPSTALDHALQLFGVDRDVFCSTLQFSHTRYP